MTPAVIRSKIKKAVTDSDGEIRLSPDKPGVSNLLSIYAALMDKQPEDVVGEFHGLGYGALKEAVTDAVLSHLEPLQKTYREVRADKALLNTIMEQGRVAAGKVAYKTLWKVQKKSASHRAKFKNMTGTLVNSAAILAGALLVC